MEAKLESREAQYTNELNNIEAQIKNNDSKKLIKKTGIISDALCAKLVIGFTTILIFSPFPICDIYYARTDMTCVNESQKSHNLNITLQSYLLASGIIGFLGLGIVNFCLFFLDCNFYQTKKNDENDLHSALYLLNWISHLFGFSWLILGCVLFWAYTTIENCSQSVHDYLFARFIIMLIFHAFKIIKNNQE